jgi:hypothetical protein
MIFITAKLQVRPEGARHWPQIAPQADQSPPAI